MNKVDIAIAGAGAAGLMTAIHAARRNKNLSIVLLDSREKIGAKILISGGTRCNVTNRKVTPQDYFGGPSHFVKHVMEAFTPAQTISFFEEIGVELVLEATGKYFPTTHSGKSVLEALMREAQKCGVTFQFGKRLTAVETKSGEFILHLEDLERQSAKLFTKKLVLCTGGLSLPETGSDGKGLEIAKSLGHAMVETVPALTPLLTGDAVWKELSGITLEAQLFYYSNGKKQAQSQPGGFLFTHFGFSGPTALDISRFWARADKNDKPEIRISFLPSENAESLTAKLKKVQKTSPNKQLKNVLSEDFLFPSRFSEAFLYKTGSEPSQKIGALKDKPLQKLAAQLTDTVLEITGVYGYRKAEVTAGGVDLKTVSVSTLESKIVPGLYFAGEILDVDGRIGGFNFQWAWSTGSIAGRSAAKSLSK